MSANTEVRKLAAIVFTDMVGYSELVVAEHGESYLCSRQKNGLEKVALPQ